MKLGVDFAILTVIVALLHIQRQFPAYGWQADLGPGAVHVLVPLGSQLLDAFHGVGFVGDDEVALEDVISLGLIFVNRAKLDLKCYLRGSGTGA